MFRMKKKDIAMLTTLAEFRILTMFQITALHFSSKKVARRRLGEMGDAGLIEMVHRGFGRARGRPESVFSLSHAGIELLKKKGILPGSIENDKVSGDNISCLDHQLLANWFRIHLAQIEKVLPRLTVRFLSPTSPFHTCSQNDMPLVWDNVPIRGSGDKSIGFTPDGVFSITDKEQQRSLLFFLEIDMGTESLASPTHDSQDISRKITNYQAYFRLSKYKRYEEIWESNFNGFRLLVLTNTSTRMRALCRLIQEMPPSDFVWVTDQDRMFSQGLADAVWARGGKLDNPLQSILGSKMCRPSPIPPLKP